VNPTLTGRGLQQEAVLYGRHEASDFVLVRIQMPPPMRVPRQWS
jgi:hypothetical protein